ncbi:helix-turn-helix domain-containing protein [Paraglaciecola sp.]|uniref:helix-turn-helix domain-containing protein n=1 Tax=Paraglaciecola sp. TaxID=1920173 RepID=UPI003EFA3216
MFDFIFNTADAFLLLNFVLSCLLLVGAWYFRTLLSTSPWFVLIGFLNGFTIFLVFGYFQTSVYSMSHSVLDSPLMVMTNAVHFIAPVVMIRLLQKQLTSSSHFRWFEKGYLILTGVIMVYFMYRYIFADFYMCPSLPHCAGNHSVDCSKQTHCAVSGLYGLASLLKCVFVGMLIRLWIKHQKTIKSAHWLLAGVMLCYGVYWAWRSLSALLIISGILPIDSTVALLVAMELLCGGILFAWFIQLVSQRLLAEHGLKITAEQISKQKLEKNVTKLKNYLDKHQPQFQKNLTLERLAQQVDMPSRELSAVINQHFQTNYTDFLNSLRIEQAQFLLKQQSEVLSIQDIFSQVGFNSKTAFNTAFKKQTGLTPSQYRDHQPLV